MWIGRLLPEILAGLPMSPEMSNEEVQEEFQIISVVVKWTSADILRRRPDWTPAQAEHFIDSSYQEIAAEAREAGDRMIDGIIEEMEKYGKETRN
jgi:hypothetical protein